MTDRKGKFIAVANMKGGVGKTTTVVSLAEALAADDENAKVLVIDLDPQASASVSLAGDALLKTLIDTDRTFEFFLDKRLLKEEQIDVLVMLRSHVSSTWHQNRQLDLTLLPCGPYLRIVEREIIYSLSKSKASIDSIDSQITKLFRKDILVLSKAFDYIIFDCAPGISPVTEIAIRLSDLVIVPTVPDYLSVYGLNGFVESIWGYRAHGLPIPKNRPRVLITRMHKGISQHVEVLESLRTEAADPACRYNMFEMQIPTSAALVEAITMAGMPTFTQKYTKPVISGILMPLVEEVKGML